MRNLDRPSERGGREDISAVEPQWALTTKTYCFSDFKRRYGSFFVLPELMVSNYALFLLCWKDIVSNYNALCWWTGFRQSYLVFWWRITLSHHEHFGVLSRICSMGSDWRRTNGDRINLRMLSGVPSQKQNYTSPLPSFANKIRSLPLASYYSWVGILGEKGEKAWLWNWVGLIWTITSSLKKYR